MARGMKLRILGNIALYKVEEQKSGKTFIPEISSTLYRNEPFVISSDRFIICHYKQ